MKIDETLASRILLYVLQLSILGLFACGGGGGGGGAEGRTRVTAIRIIHASIDSGPVVAKIGGLPIQQARFAQESEYIPVEQGPAVLDVELVNSPNDSLGRINTNFLNETEYTIFISGETREGRRRVQVLEEPVVEPEAEKARVQVLNGIFGSRTISVDGIGFAVNGVAEGTSSGYVDAPSGEQVIRILSSSGALLAEVNTLIPDRGEFTIVASGSRDLNLTYTRIYQDFD